MATSFLTKSAMGVEQIEPALTPPTIKPVLPKKAKLGSSKSKTRKREIPEGLWTKCPSCETMIFDKELDANLKVCPKCQFHFPIGSRERINSLVETCTFEESDASLESVDILQFTGVSSYASKLEQYKKSTHLKDAVCTGIGRIGT